MMRNCTGLVACVVAFGAGLLVTQPLAEESWGQFNGEVVAKFMRDGRNMQLEKPFSYVDPRGRRWDVPAGAVTDGASIPRVLWVSYPPFTGQYRSAAVIHDYYCQTKSRNWKDTHEVFYNAMRASGVPDRTAKTMYAAVYYFGPRWGIGVAARGPGAIRGLSADQEKSVLRDLEAWISKDNPSLQDIGKKLDSPG